MCESISEYCRVVVLENAPTNWDDMLSLGKCQSLLLYHSICWADRIEELLGLKRTYICVYRNDELVLALQAFVGVSKLVPEGLSLRTKIRVYSKRVLQLLTRKKDFLWYGQPVEFVGEIGEDEYKLLSSTIESHLAASRLRLAGGDWPIDRLSVLPKSFQKREWATLILNLRVSEQELQKSIRPSARKEISKALRRGVDVKRIETIEELREYHAFALECSRRYGKEMYDFSDFETMWRHLRRFGYFETFVAYLSGEMIAGLSIWGDREMVAELGSFQSQKAYDAKLGGPDLVKWFAISWAQKTGVGSFDLSGFNPSPSNEKEKSIRRFKEKWSQNEQHFVTLRSAWL